MGPPAVVTALAMLVGAEVGGVAFVRDYVEIHFDGPILRALSAPVVEMDGTGGRFPSEGSRDRLCQLIGRTVLAAQEGAESLVLDFDDSVRLRIPLVTSRLVVEAAHLVPESEGRPDVANMVVWESIP
ncbi:hypothetical protein [Cellulomonas sp.]|uniref:hypothetical protein n=1 Tax=Cellulomonas sp. TaxID=40001 RepID=UPI00258EC9E5|nr:hypothetical protein [Cellulomonas sp.]MCR6689355.1 hypothetical protein [Cellulomonas sp.]